VDNNNATLVRIFNLEKDQIKFLDLADHCIQQYWLHTSQTNLHQTKAFKKDFVEHFGVYGMYSNMVYNSGDYLCSPSSGTCQEHQLLVIIYYLFIIYLLFII
jgi:hypothetical protein